MLFLQSDEKTIVKQTRKLSNNTLSTLIINQKSQK